MGAAFIKTIKIVHEELGVDEYRFLAGYFRMVGVFVWECICQKESSEGGRYDAVLRVSRKEFSIYGEVPDITIPGFPMNSSKEEKKAYLNGVIEHLWKDNAKEELKEIASIYVDNDLMLHGYSMGYFYKCQKIEEENALKFADAYKALTSCLKGKEPTLYSIYARAYLACMVNEVCKMQDIRRRFSTKKLIEYLKTALGQDRGFSNVYVLSGFLCDLDSKYHRDAPDYYKKAYESIKGNPYADYICYRLGRCYEKIALDKKEAFFWYRKACEENPWDYRSIYKIAMEHKRNAEYEMACEKFRKIISIMENKKEADYLQPMEYEYLFKAYLEIGSIYFFFLKDAETAERYLKYCDQILDNLDKLNEFFKAMYTDKETAEERREYVRGRLDSEKIYQTLILVYTELNKKEKVEEYEEKTKRGRKKDEK